MSMFDESTELGGSVDKSPSHTHLVSLWHIPGGCEYHLAKVREFYFEGAESAELFKKMYDYPPEMAMVIPCT